MTVQSPKVPFKSILHYHPTKGPPVRIFKFSSRHWFSPAHLSTRGIMASDLGWGSAFTETQFKVIFEKVLEYHSCPVEEALQEELLVGLQAAGDTVLAGVTAAIGQAAATAVLITEKEMAIPAVFLPGESQGWRSLVAAIYGISQSRTRLTRLSSSSSSIGDYKIMSIIPCAVQSVLIAYLFYTRSFVPVNSILLTCPVPFPLLFSKHKFVLYICESYRTFLVNAIWFLRTLATGNFF